MERKGSLHTRISQCRLLYHCSPGSTARGFTSLDTTTSRTVRGIGAQSDVRTSMVGDYVKICFPLLKSDDVRIRFAALVRGIGTSLVRTQPAYPRVAMLGFVGV